MKYIVTSLITFLTIQIQAQNWMGNTNFIDLYNQSDIIVIGSISQIKKISTDTTTKIAIDTTLKKINFLGPRKNLTLRNVREIKGKFSNDLIFYRDLFNGCGNAPILVENKLNKRTLIFGKIKNDSIFQIGSMNESPDEIAKTLIGFNQINSDFNPKNISDWFYKSAKNKDVFYLLNNSISFEQEPLFSSLNDLNFSLEQRNWFYNKIKSFKEYNYDNEGIISILVKYKDQRLKEIIKEFIINSREDPYSGIGTLMNYYYSITENSILEKLITKFNDDWRKDKRIKVIDDFISKI